jgi:ParB family chromosome partitioning protein
MNAMPEVSRYEAALPIAMIRESETNPRKTYDPKKLHELSESIKANPLGVVEPLVVQEMAKDDYRVIAGSRRLRAAKLAGLTAIPARVATLTEEQVLEIQLIENLQREDVHPVEEAEGYARLMKIDKEYTPEWIAERVGKDRSYVYKRLTLVRIPREVKDAFLAGRISIGHALAIARLGSSVDQMKAFGECFETRWGKGGRVPNFDVPADITVGQLERTVREEILLDLSAAPWKKDDAELLPVAGACSACPKRTGSNPTLFDDIKKGDFCTDSSCYQAKRAALIARVVETGKQEGKPVVRVSTDYEIEKGSIGRDAFREVSKKDRCEHVEAAVVVMGRGRVGEKLEICRTKTCKKHWRQLGQHQGGGVVPKASASEQLKRKRQLLDARIEMETRRAVLREITETNGANPHRLIRYIGKSLIERMGHDDQRELSAALGVEGIKSKHSTDFAGPLLAGLKARRRLGDYLAFLAAAVSLRWTNIDKDAVKLLGIDQAALKKKVSGPLIGRFEASLRKSRKGEAVAKEKKASPAKTGPKKAKGR